ncbi:chemotaxis protein CheA [Enterococcus bulliens]
MDDNSVYRTLFFEETDDHLQQLNDHILELESHPEDRERLNDIFRSAHTLKGMAATMGYDVMTQLTHKMENLFDLFKTGTIPVTHEHISLIFRCLDRLGDLVEQLREEEELEIKQISDLLSELDVIENQNGGTLQQAVEQIQTTKLLTHFSSFDTSDQFVVEEAKNQGYEAFYIGVRIDKESMLKGPRAFLIMEKLGKSGDILHTEPSIETIEAGEFEQDIYLLYLTKEAEHLVKESIEANSEIEEVLVLPFQESLVQEDRDQKRLATLVLPNDHQTDTKKSGTELKKAKAATNQSIRVDLTRLDQFLNLVSELVVYRNQLEDANGRQEATEVKDSLEQVSRLTSELQELVLKIRMQQVNVVFSRFPRMVRDLSNELNKEMELIVHGEETELDKTVVSELSEPLVHLLRNSADHGIEAPATRIALGKPEKGTIKLAATQEGNRVLITLSDDGKGIDPLVIAKSAAKKGIDTTNMSDEQIQHLIFHPGFSTAKEVTNISGRGVGMDAVQSKINQLGGTIELKSIVDQGTSFIIKLPLTLSIIQALMIRVEQEHFALPLDTVERVVRIKESEIVKTAGKEVYRYQSELIPIIRTNELLKLSEVKKEKTFVIIVSIDQKNYGILADELIGQQEIVIKKIDSFLQSLNTYQGATILGNGTVALILDIDAICQEVQASI